MCEYDVVKHTIRVKTYFSLASAERGLPSSVSKLDEVLSLFCSSGDVGGVHPSIRTDGAHVVTEDANEESAVSVVVAGGRIGSIGIMLEPNLCTYFSHLSLSTRLDISSNFGMTM